MTTVFEGVVASVEIPAEIPLSVYEPSPWNDVVTIPVTVIP